MYRLYILFYYPRYMFLDNAGKVKFCLNYLFKNRYAYTYALFQAHMESGNFTNTNTIARNNPFNFVFSSNLGVLTTNDGGWSKFSSIASGVYAFAYWVNKHPTVQAAMVDNAPNVWYNNEYGKLDGTAAAMYFANVSQKMIDANFCTTCTGVSYNNAIFAYYTSTQDGNGSIDVSNVFPWYYRYGIPLLYVLIIFIILWFTSKSFRSIFKNKRQF